MDKSQALILFTRNLFYMVKIGAPLGEALKKLKEDVKETSLRNAVGRVEIDVNRGAGLGEAMTKHAGVFPPEYVRMVEAAEQTDTLPKVLEELAAYLEEVQATIRDVRSAIMYPVLILNLAVPFFLLIYFYVMRSFVELFHGVNLSLPIPTKIFIGLSEAAYNPVFLIFLLTAVVVVDVVVFTKRTIGSDMLFHLPFVGEIIRKAYHARFSRALGFMLASGVPLNEALEKVILVAESGPVAQIFKQVSDEVARGGSFSQAVEKQQFFTETYRWMIRTAEAREELPRGLADAADYYEKDLHSFYGQTLTLLEPAMMFGVGVLVAFLIFSIFLPLYHLVGQLK